MTAACLMQLTFYVQNITTCAVLFLFLILFSFSYFFIFGVLCVRFQHYVKRIHTQQCSCE